MGFLGNAVPFLLGTNRPTQQAVPGDVRGFRGQGISQAQNLLPLLGALAQGQNVSGLQRMGTNSLSQFLSQPAPEMRALEISLPALQAQLSGSPGQQVLGPLQQVFNRNLTDQLQATSASAPGRFSSGLLEQQGRLRERSMQDFNLLASQVLEQGLARQLQAASTLGLLSSQAGQQPFGRAAQATALGQNQTQMQLQALLAALGPTTQSAFGGPITQQSSPFEQWFNLLLGGLTAAGGGAGGGAR